MVTKPFYWLFTKNMTNKRESIRKIISLFMHGDNHNNHNNNFTQLSKSIAANNNGVRMHQNQTNSLFIPKLETNKQRNNNNNNKYKLMRTTCDDNANRISTLF